MTELREFLDLEYRLQGGEDSWRESAEAAGAELCEELVDGDSSLLRRRLLEDRGLRLLALRRWKEAQRRTSPTSLGDRLARSLVGLGWLMTGLGLLLGFGAATAALSAPSGEPINLWICLGVLVLSQMALLGFGGIALLWVRSRGRQRLHGGLEVLRQWVHGRLADREASGGAGPVLAHTRRIEGWAFFRLSQRFGACFNLGAILAFLLLLLFRELQFGWSTTPDGIGTTHVQGLVEWIAAPWAWAFPPEWVPDADMIAATRWNPLLGHFHGSDADGRGWWPFLLMALTFWGLMPRMVLWTWSSRRLDRALSTLPWDHRRVQELFDHMFPTSLEAGADPAAQVEGGSPVDRSDDCTMVSWGEWPSPWPLRAGGTKLHADGEVIAGLRASRPEHVGVVVEGGQAPDKRFLGFLRDLREGIGRQASIHLFPIQVGGKPAEERDRSIWRRTLARLGDAQLHVRSDAPAWPKGDKDG